MSTVREWLDVVDEDGNPARILKVTRQVQSPHLAGNSTFEGLAELFDESGKSVNQNRDGTFRGVHSGKVYRLR